VNKLGVDYRLYLVTDRNLLDGRDLALSIEQAIKGGVTLVQLREKSVSTREFLQGALKVKEITSRYEIPLIINDRLDIALAVEADGLHIGQDDLPMLTVISKPTPSIFCSLSKLRRTLQTSYGRFPRFLYKIRRASLPEIFEWTTPAHQTRHRLVARLKIPPLNEKGCPWAHSSFVSMHRILHRA